MWSARPTLSIFFKNLYFSSDHVEGNEGSAAPHQAGHSYHDPIHGWFQGVQVGLASRLAMAQLFFPIVLEEFFPKVLPDVRVVTQLVIRRQLRRRIFNFTLAEMIESLPCLENIVYEPWLSQDNFMAADDECMSSLFCDKNLYFISSFNVIC